MVGQFCFVIEAVLSATICMEFCCCDSSSGCTGKADSNPGLCVIYEQFKRTFARLHLKNKKTNSEQMLFLLLAKCRNSFIWKIAYAYVDVGSCLDTTFVSVNIDSIFCSMQEERFNSFYNCVELPVIEVIHVQEEWIEKYRKTKSSWETLLWDSFVRINCCWQASESFENYKLFIKVKIKFHWGFWLFFHHRDRARRPLCSCVMAKHYPFFSAVVCISTSIQFE